MIDLKETQKQIAEIKKMQKAILKEKENIDFQRKNYNKKRIEFEKKAKDETNPVRQAKNEREKEKIDEENKKIDALEQEISEKEKILKAEYDKFISSLKIEADSEMNKITLEVKHPSIPRLKEEKKKLMETRKSYESQLKEWEENGVLSIDSRYRKLKNVDLPILNGQIRNINKNIRNLSPKKLEADWDNLETISSILKNHHRAEYKLEELEEKIQEIRNARSKKRKIAEPNTDEKKFSVDGYAVGISAAMEECIKAVQNKDKENLEKVKQMLQKNIDTAKKSLEILQKIPSLKISNKQKLLNLIKKGEKQLEIADEQLEILEEEQTLKEPETLDLEQAQEENMKNSLEEIEEPDEEPLDEEKNHINVYDFRIRYQKNISKNIAECRKAKNNDELKKVRNVLARNIKRAKWDLESNKRNNTIKSKDEEEYLSFIRQGEDAIEVVDELIRKYEEQSVKQNGVHSAEQIEPKQIQKITGN